MRYAIAFPNKKSKLSPDLRFGTFDTRVKAKLAYLIAMKELSETGTYTDQFINLHFAVAQRLGFAKIVPIP